ncbi:hypothetical protein PROP_02159 [Propionicimonas sp. T2.31MG-18]|uniref:sulfurtransferase n=1 Tax=Propionicimonas sp. T2.31MG-18 TaxID=3157620 RepID=UPI0035EF0750
MTDPHTVIAVQDALARIDRGERPVILDASLDLATPRFDGDYRATSGHGEWRRLRIDGSRHIDLLTQWVDPAAPYHFGAPRPDAFARELAAAGIDGSRPVWLYDRTNLMWASRLWWTLRNAGIPAAVLDGGLRAWLRAGGPVASGGTDDPVRPVAPPPAVDLGLWVTRAEVEEALVGAAPHRPALICALSSDAMWGRVPTRYTRRGHIPGSLNLAGHALLDGDGSVLHGPGAAAVDALGLDLRRPLIVYCGGGISASLTALGLVHWGAADVRIYDGSLEEWSAVPELALVSA